MYEVGARVIYGTAGVCKVESVGPLTMKGVPKDVNYYTLTPIYQSGRIFAPVDGSVHMRPALTREEALELIRQIPYVEENFVESNNPRVLNDHYQVFLKSGDCMDLVRVIRSVTAKAKHVAKKGRRLGSVDERSMRRAEEMLHNELAVALDISPSEVKPLITRSLEQAV